MKKYLLITPTIILLGLSACTELALKKEEVPLHPAVGKWAQPGKCQSMPWLFGQKSVSWGDNGGYWVDTGGKIKVTSYIAQDNATMVIYFSPPQNNVMRTLSVNYGGSNVPAQGGKLVKCSN
ncbi:MAG: hypothetical protein ACK5LE_08445 [Alphaproteobacteria bacterium]